MTEASRPLLELCYPITARFKLGYKRGAYAQSCAYITQPNEGERFWDIESHSIAEAIASVVHPRQHLQINKLFILSQEKYHSLFHAKTNVTDIANKQAKVIP